MKLSEYITKLEGVLASCPEAKDYQVIYAKDDEGNGYGEIYFDPSVGYYDDDDRDWMSKENLMEDGYEDLPVNSVCVN